jgi:hypothetical protein
LTFVHDVILRPMGLADPAKPLPDDRATFYVPTTFWRGVSTDPRDGRRLMSMRDLACCAGGMALYSTPPISSASCWRHRLTAWTVNSQAEP